MAENDKVVWAENISYLAKERGIKLMDLAEEAGVALSFFSRARKGDSRADANVLTRIAERLGISLDTLMKCDLTAMTENERLVMNFIDKVILDTNAGKLDWRKDTRDSMRMVDEEGDPLYPMSGNVGIDGDTVVKYQSHFAKDGMQITPTGTSYHTAIGEMTALYIVHVGVTEPMEGEESRNNYYQGYELYISDFASPSPVCCSFNGTNRKIAERLNDLYCLARIKSDHILLSEGTIGIMKDYLADQMAKRSEVPF